MNFVKVIQDNKTKQSRGYGFLYMYDAIGDAAVERFATEHQNRITLFGKTRVFLARHDYQRAVPLRDPNKASHDGNMPKAQPPPPPHQQQQHHHQQQQHLHRRHHQHHQQHHHQQQHQQYRGSNPNASYMPSAVAPQHEPSITHHHPHQAQGTQHSYQQQQPNYYPAAPAPYAPPPQQTYAPSQQPVSYGHPPDTHVSTTYPHANPASNPPMQSAVPQTGGYAPPPPQAGYNTSYPAAPNAAVHVPAAPPPQAPYSTGAQPHSTTVYHGQVDNSQYGAPVPAQYPPPPPAQYAVPAAAATTPIPVVATAQQPQHQSQPYAPYQTPQPTTATPSAIPPPQPPAAHSLSTKIAIHHLPPETTPKDVVQLLSKLALSIRRCTMDYDGPHICFAHVDMTTTQDATRCITLAQQSQLRYKGRTLTASVDLHPPPDGKSIPVGMGAPVSSGPRPPPRRGGGGGGGGGAGRFSGRGGGRGRYRHRENRRNMNKPY